MRKPKPNKRGKKMRTAMKLYEVFSIEDVKKDKNLKEKVLQKYHDINVDFDWWYDAVYENWIEDLKNYGFEDVKIYFSGFSRQGDGACFISNDINLSLLAEKLNFSTREINIIKALQEQGYIYSELTHNSQYYHECSTCFVIYDGYTRATWKRILKIVARLEIAIKNLIIELSKDIYRDLEKEYDYLTSEDSILETLEINDYEFTENGNIF
jgi:hypothetical protein